MGESFTQAVVEGPQPKPSRFQFVPVPGEFTSYRGRWKCRDSYHPNAETLEFEKNKSKEEETNPDKISVFFKLRQQQQEPEPEPEPPQPPPQESTIQVTSVKSTRPDTGDPGDSEVVTTDSTESIIITRKNGVTIVRKTSNSLLLPDEKYDQIRQLSIDDFENKEKKQQVPPTPMNTPPASLAVVDTSIQSTTSETTPGHSSSRKPSKEDSSPFDASSATPAPSQLETPQQQKPTTTRHFQVEPVVLSEPSTPAPVAPAPSIETLTSTSPPVTQQLAPSLSEPTFQVIQTEESKNMSMDSVKNVVDAAALSAPAPAPLSQSDRLNHVDEVEGTTPSNVMITVSSAAAALEKKEEAAFAAAGSLDSCGIPISGGGAAAQTSAPHSTPYGTPKDTHIQQQQQPVVFEEILTANGPPPQPSSPLLPALITTTTSAPTIAPASSPIINASGSSIPAASTSGISLFPSGGVTSSLTTPSTTADTHTPIDNKIEQAMELVKTHLTYAVREEVDTLRNTIAELEYQMRESQYECTYYRQNCAPDLIEQASSFVHQQMASHQRPAARRAVSTAGIFDGSSSGGGGGQASSGASASASSAHMRNLQNQIQQMKQITPITTNTCINSTSTSTTAYTSTPTASIPAATAITTTTAPPKPSPTTSESSLITGDLGAPAGAVAQKMTTTNN
ncbi:Flocculation protein FLO11 [Caenorhabditis elegans]|uniref:Flocculation protein FLO11 n=1 Tax=Caenorhabditis elegans TaxID=6239 RepID=A0A7R9SUI8_CAEEL|nr:Flocculation protein FLO11 [Caenorhabditis elegans]CAD8118572.1 Flocculation protein FLO11 [Caenorhabditis elegans]